jgi:integrase
MQTWDKPEMQLFLEASRDGSYYNLLYTELYTGMRLGEILAPRWRDLDMERGTLEVTRSLYQRRGQLEFGSLKNASSYRCIQLLEDNLEVLKEQRKQQEFYHMMLEIPFTQDDLIFSHPDGSPFLPSSVSRAWQDTARHAGLKVIRFHDGRHTHASILMATGWNPKLVSERLGHSNISTTMDIYSHTTPEMYLEAMKRFDEYMKQ